MIIHIIGLRLLCWIDMSELLRQMDLVLLKEYPLTAKEIADRIGQTTAKSVYTTIDDRGEGIIDIVDEYRPYKYKVYGF